MNPGDPAGDGLLDPGGAMDRLAAWRGRIDRVAADTSAMSAALQALRITAADGNGLAEVTIDSGGALVDLRLGRQIQRVAPEVTARTILGAIRDARAELANRSQEIIVETMGADPAAQAVAERVRERMQPPPEWSGETDDSRHRR